MYSNHLNMLSKEIKRFFEKPIPDQSLRIDNGILGDRTLKSSK